ncbi:hypothetical protein GCM10009551_031190 [Nocardiopsis tropica]
MSREGIRVFTKVFRFLRVGDGRVRERGRPGDIFPHTTDISVDYSRVPLRRPVSPYGSRACAGRADGLEPVRHMYRRSPRVRGVRAITPAVPPEGTSTPGRRLRWRLPKTAGRHPQGWP